MTLKCKSEFTTCMLAIIIYLLRTIIFLQGCYKKTLELLRNNLLIIGAIGVAVAVVQVNAEYM